MEQLRKIVVAVLLAVWTFPAVSGAAPNRGEARLPAAVTDTSGARTGSPAAQQTQTPASSEAQRLAQREQQTPELQDFRGGGVSIYIGSGALLVVIIILLIILL
jgi:hypothetical protein